MKRKNEKGQSTVEFVLVFLPLMAISFFLFQLAAVFGYGVTDACQIIEKEERASLASMEVVEK